MVLRVLTGLLVPIWSLFNFRFPPSPSVPTVSEINISAKLSLTPSSPHPPLQFELRHLHAVSSTAHVSFLDVPSSPNAKLLTDSGETESTYTLQPRLVQTFRPPSFDAFIQERAQSIKSGSTQCLQWGEKYVFGPDVERRKDLLLLAKMTNNAYLQPGDSEWYDLGKNWNNSYPFGWEPDEDGFRGNVFATPDNSTVIVSIKGTSAGMFGGGGPTSKKDKFNDNLLFSCCCAYVGWSWTPVCGCYRGDWKCDQNCLERALIDDSLFYPIGTNLYNNVTYIPESNIWIIGHSLGGALASLLGVTFGVPVVTFESPGEKMAATRLHLPSPPSTHHVTHVYHTADPIAMGTCNGVLSACAISGYAMESRCHLGKTILYDTVTNLSWSVDVRAHKIVDVIEKILSEPWAASVKEGREVPQAVPEDDCVECYSWEFGDFPAPEKGKTKQSP